MVWLKKNGYVSQSSIKHICCTQTYSKLVLFISAETSTLLVRISLQTIGLSTRQALY